MIPGTTSSNTLATKYMRIMLFGAPGTGKTFTALTASKHWPGELPAKVSLDDVLFCLFDDGGLGGLPEQGITVPHVFDGCAELGAGVLFPQVLSKCINVVGAALKEGVGVVVFDSLSTLNAYGLLYYMAANRDDSRSAYGDLLKMNAELARVLMTVPADLVLIAHPKVMTEEQAKAVRSGASIPGNYDIIPDIPGQGLGRYVIPTRLLGYLVAKVTPSKSIKRELNFGVSSPYMTKNTFSRTVQAVEEPHLGKLFARIRGSNTGVGHNE